MILAEVHKEHFGIEKCKSYARTFFYWPGMGKEIEERIKNCTLCQTFKPKSSNKCEFSSWPAAKKPFERIHIDFGEIQGKPW